MLEDFTGSLKDCCETKSGQNMNERSNWRLTGQERYLIGLSLVHKKYRRYLQNSEWDHDHCAFCWAKFMVEDCPDVLHRGYATTDEYHWICEKCFEDFKEKFDWKVVEESN